MYPLCLAHSFLAHVSVEDSSETLLPSRRRAARMSYARARAKQTHGRRVGAQADRQTRLLARPFGGQRAEEGSVAPAGPGPPQWRLAAIAVKAHSRMVQNMCPDEIALAFLEPDGWSRMCVCV